MDIDRVRELLDAEAIDAPFVVTDADYPPAFVFDKKSWDEDCADYLIGDADSNGYIREQLIKLFDVMPNGGYPKTDRSKIINTQCMAMYMMNIGGQILENAIKAGLTIEILGELTE